MFKIVNISSACNVEDKPKNTTISRKTLSRFFRQLPKAEENKVVVEIRNLRANSMNKSWIVCTKPKTGVYTVLIEKYLIPTPLMKIIHSYTDSADVLISAPICDNPFDEYRSELKRKKCRRNFNMFGGRGGQSNFDKWFNSMQLHSYILDWASRISNELMNHFEGLSMNN